MRESEERYRLLIELTPAIIAIHTAAPEGKWVYTNAPGARLLGAAKAEELIGKPVLDFIHPDYHEFIRRRWRRTQVEREPTEPAEIKMVRLDGEIIDVETRGIPATYEGRPATYAFIVDISERKRAEEALRLSADLQRSREQLVAAREEERRRLRRDLHDDLGPQLASLTMRAEAARDLVPIDPTRAQEVLEGLAEQAQEAVADVRRLVYALRPPALDALGLVEALRSQAGRLGNSGLRISIDGPGEIPPLPAAAEVACYRIALEALTNVARHAEARNCTVRLALDEEAGTLHLEVEDDGRGIGEDHREGVGLTSMRERAEELGGSCTIEAVPFGSGTRIRVFLPYASDDAMGSKAGEPDLEEA